MAPETHTPFRRIGRKFVAGGTVVVALSIVFAVLLPVEQKDVDPSKVGPDRFLTVEEARIEALGDEVQLYVTGKTNLVDGAVLRIEVRTRSGLSLQVYSAQAKGGRFSLSELATGGLAGREFQLAASFALEQQPEAVQKALHYQPRALATTAPLLVHQGVDASFTATDEFKALFDAVNKAPRDPFELDRLDQQAVALSGRLWIAKEKAALEKLRLAIVGTRRLQDAVCATFLDSSVAIPGHTPTCCGKEPENWGCSART